MAESRYYNDSCLIEWFGIIWYGMVWYGSTTMFTMFTISYLYFRIVCQNAGLIVWQNAGATIWQKAINIMIHISLYGILVLYGKMQVL